MNNYHIQYLHLKKLLFSTFLLAGLCLFSQHLNQQIRLGQQYEEAGRWKEARQLYESMLAYDPNNAVIYERLKVLYLQTFAFTEAQLLIERQIKRNPSQPHLEVDLAQVLYRMGKEKEAFEKFDSIIKRYHPDRGVHQMVASAYTDEKLYKRATEVYLSGRKQLNQPAMYAMSLSQLYAAQKQFTLASEELLLYLKHNPKLMRYVQSQYLKFPKSQSVLKQLCEPLKKAVHSNPEYLDVYQILIKLYEHHEQITEAFKTAQILEDKTTQKNQGQILFQFAGSAFTKGYVSESKQAYSKILTTYPHFKAKDQVLYGLAKCYEAENEIEQAINKYQKIVQEYPNRHISKSAAMSMGLLQRDRMLHPENAKQTFLSIIHKYPETPESWTSELELAYCYLLQNDTLAARSLLEQNIYRTHPDRPGHHLRALYQLAQLCYFQCHYKEAGAYLDSLSLNKFNSSSFQHPVVNDGLRLRFFIQQYTSTHISQLMILSKADFYSFQRKYQKAISLLDTLLTGEINLPIQGDALFKRGTFYILLNQNKQALDNFTILIETLPDHYLADQALERCGYLYEKLNKPNHALERYEQLLTDYPHSLLLHEIRTRIRKLEK